jgi:hypothetical protein
MNTDNAGIPQGATYYGETATVPTTYDGVTTKLEGKVVYVPDRTVTESGVAATQRSAHMVKATIVRNDGTFTMKGRRAVSWKSTYRGKRVDGYTCTTNQEIAGIVDPHLVANANGGVRQGDLFLLYDISGPVECMVDLAAGANNVISEGSFVGALTAATSQATTAGRVYAQATTNAGIAALTDGTEYLRQRFVRAQAMTARTTANTTVPVLVGIV